MDQINVLSKRAFLLLKSRYMLIWLICHTLLTIPAGLHAQAPDFAAAEKFDAPNLQKLMGTTQVIPFFLKKSNRFWMTAESLLAKSSSGKTMSSVQVQVGNTSVERQYFLVDMDRKEKKPLFNKSVILARLAKLTGKPVEKQRIDYTGDFSEDEKTVSINYDGIRYDYAYQQETLVQHAAPQKAPSVYLIGNSSPDKKWLIYARHHNLYLKKTAGTADTTARALSADGAAHFSFSINDEDQFASNNTETDAVWADDSRNFYILRKDTRKVEHMTVINSLSAPRPYVVTYPYELPGDEHVAQFELFIGNTAANTLKKVDIARWPDQEVSLVRNGILSNGEILLVRKKRSRDEMELCAVDLNTGKLHVLINEVSKPFINEDLFNVSVINGRKNILWWSDRTGWGQYYRYDLNGKLLNAVTAGEWTAGKIAAADDAKQCLYYYGYGKEKDRNPNYAFVYKVGFDGTKDKLLTPENATHAVFISPTKAYLVDNYSAINLEPRSVVRNNEGGFLQEVLKPDFSQLYAYGWKQPEMFTVKAKDGVTDLYGLMWKPYHFDPDKKYPIISQVYPGPFTETVWNEFTILDRYNNTSLAQTGFIVVVMGHRGSSPYRKASYYKFGYGNLRDYALEDDKYGLEQLGERYHFIDMKKVGIFGHSGGGMMSAAAICTYPDFYKVAVSSSGNHDNTIYNRTWGESYQGFDQPVALNQSLAKDLKGHLLLVSGESDQNVNVANTYRMADALIKADKDFDLLILPGQSHTYEEPYKTYFQKRLRAYFAKYLLIQ